MKKKIISLLIVSFLLSFLACDKGYFGVLGLVINEVKDGNLKYFTGAIANSFYTNNWDGNKALVVSGKPFMVVKFDKVSNEVIDFEFGLSEVTQTVVGPNPIPEPTMDASTVDEHKKLKLKSPVVLLVNWPVTAWDQEITNGQLNAGGVIFSYKSSNSIYTFSYLPAGSMVGGVKSKDGYTGYQTEHENDFNMLEK